MTNTSLNSPKYVVKPTGMAFNRADYCFSIVDLAGRVEHLCTTSIWGYYLHHSESTAGVQVCITSQPIYQRDGQQRMS